MNPEFKKLAERRAEEVAEMSYNRDEREWKWSTNTFISGALDPVLEEARRAMYRAEAFNEAVDLCHPGGMDTEFCKNFRILLHGLAQAEREKLKKILAP